MNASNLINRYQNNDLKRITSQVDAYQSFKSYKVKGEIIEVRSNDKFDMKIDENSYAKVELKKNMDLIKGQMKEIDSKDIKKIKLMSKEEYQNSLNQEKEVKGKLEEVLDRYNIENTKENMEALKELKKHNVKLSRDSILSYTSLKKNMENVVKNMGYEKAMKLIAKGVNFSKDSIGRIATELDKLVKEEKYGIKSESKEISFDEARKIAKELYGSTMGKDILDIIRSMAKAGETITKSKVDSMFDLFTKIEDIKDIDSKIIINMKDESVSIASLYNNKNYVKQSNIESSFSHAVYKNEAVKLSAKDIKLMNEDIKKYLEDNNVDSNKENIKIAGELLRANKAVTKENIDYINDTKSKIDKLTKNLDHKTAVILEQRGIDLENENIDKILNEIENITKEDKKQVSKKDMNSKEVKALVDKIKNMKLDKATLVKLVENKGDITFKEINNSLNNINPKEISDMSLNAFKESIKYTDALNYLNANLNEGNLSNMLSKDKNLMNLDLIKLKDKLAEFKNSNQNPNESVNLTDKEIEDVKDFITKIKDVKGMSKLIDMSLKTSNKINPAQILNTNLDEINNEENVSKIIKASKITNELKNIKFMGVSFALKNNMDMNLKNILASDKFIDKDINYIKENLSDVDIKELESLNQVKQLTKQDIDLANEYSKNINESEGLKAVKSLIANALSLNSGNVKRLMELKSYIDNIDNNITLENMKNLNMDELLNMNVKDLKEALELLNLEANNKNMNAIMDILKVKNSLNQTNLQNLAYTMSYKKDINIKNISDINSFVNVKNNKSMLESLDMNLRKDYLEFVNFLDRGENNKSQNANIDNIKYYSKVEVKQSIEALEFSKMQTSENNIKNLLNQNKLLKNINSNFDMNFVKHLSDRNEDINNLSLDDLDAKLNKFRASYDAYSNFNSIKDFYKEDSSLINTNIIKNNNEYTLKEFSSISSYFDDKNKSNITEISNRILDLREFITKEDEELNQKIDKFESKLKNIRMDLHENKVDAKRVYDDIKDIIRDIEENTKENANLKEEIKTIKESLNEQLNSMNKVNKENSSFELPMYYDGDFKNLQIYVNERNKRTNGIDPDNTDILLSIDTNNLGNIRVHLNVSTGNVTLGFKGEQLDKELVRSMEGNLKNLLDGLGYNYNKINFMDDTKQKNKNEDKEETNYSTSFIDMKI
ncbi:DUF6240 domain-containing protein [Peptostreptococcaceae bacterium AGR-M142]